MALTSLPEGYQLDDTNSNVLPNGYLLDKTDYNDKSSGFSNRMNEDLGKHEFNTLNSVLDVTNNKQLPMMAVPQIGGEIAGMVGDTIGNIIGSVGRTVAPETYEAGQKKLADIIKPIAENIEPAYSYAKEKAPQLTKTAEGYANMLGLGGEGIATSKVADVAGKEMQMVGKTLSTSGNTAQDLIKKQNALDFIQPKQTNKILQEASKKQGIDFETGKINVTPKDEAIADTISQVPDIDFKKKNIQENLSAVTKAYNEEAESLKPKLAKVNATVQDFQAGLRDIKDKILTTEGIDDAERKARLAAIDKMMQITNRKTGRIRGDEILDARQKLDKTFLTKAGDLTTAAEKNYKEGIKPVRDYTNNFLADTASDADVLASLQKQHYLKTAIDNVATKVPAEARDAAKAPKGLMGKAAQYSKSLVGLGGGGLFLNEMADIYPTLAQHLAPAAPILGGAYIVSKGGKKAINALKAPVIRQALGATLSKSGTLMRGGKELTLKDITTEDIAKMTPEVRQLLLEAPEKT